MHCVFVRQELKLIQIIKNLVPTSQKTQCLFITSANWSMPLTEIIAVYCENCIELINTLCGRNKKFLNVRTELPSSIFTEISGKIEMS
jgi:hypothetical protein